MTNLDKAVEAILSRYSILGTVRARAAAHALEEAGLLMPDLPKPDSHDEYGWPIYGETEYKTYFSKHPCKGIPYITCPLGEWLSAEMVREEAYRMLAAAEWLDNWDKEHSNE